jgi:hypothetical protein
MKTTLIALLCILSLQGVAVNHNSFIVKGEFLEAIDVNYRVCLIEDNGSCTSILQESDYIDYKINLEIGRKYLIDFTYGDITKSLLIEADAPGYFEVDVDFSSKQSALLSYCYFKHRYRLKAFESIDEYAVKNYQLKRLGEELTAKK